MKKDVLIDAMSYYGRKCWDKDGDCEDCPAFKDCNMKFGHTGFDYCAEKILKAVTNNEENKLIGIKEMSIEQLNNLEYKIREEKGLREFEKRKEAWEKVANAIDDFIKDYGSITIDSCGESELEIDDSYSFHEIGVFRDMTF